MGRPLPSFREFCEGRIPPPPVSANALCWLAVLALLLGAAIGALWP